MALSIFLSVQTEKVNISVPPGREDGGGGLHAGVRRFMNRENAIPPDILCTGDASIPGNKFKEIFTHGRRGMYELSGAWGTCPGL